MVAPQNVRKWLDDSTDAQTYAQRRAGSDWEASLFTARSTQPAISSGDGVRLHALRISFVHSAVADSSVGASASSGAAFAHARQPSNEISKMALMETPECDALRVPARRADRRTSRRPS